MQPSTSSPRLPLDGLVLLAVTGIAAIGIWPKEGESTVSFFWPSLTIALLGVLSLARLVAGWRVKTATNEGSEPTLRGNLWFVVLYFGYVFSLQWCGFYVGTPLFLALFIYRLNKGVPLRQRVVRTVVCGSLMLLLITGLFVYVFSLHLPMGYGAFRLFNEHIVYLPYRFM